MSYMKLPHNHHNEIDNTELLEQLNDIQHFQIVSELFKQLSDPTRIRLFWLLSFVYPSNSFLSEFRRV